MQTRLTGALAVNITSIQKNSNTPFRFKNFTWRKRIRTKSFLSYLTSYPTARRSYGKNYKEIAEVFFLFLFWMNTFPAESGGARRCSRSLATSRLPYLEATCRGVKPFCGEKQPEKGYYEMCLKTVNAGYPYTSTSSSIMAI